MKDIRIIKTLICVLAIFQLSHGLYAQDDKKQDDKKNQKLLSDSKKAKSEFVKADTTMNKMFSSSYGYAIFPKIGKGGFIVGGSGGDGTVFEQGKEIGTAKMGQVTVGAQIGGQTYREVIFFENKDALDHFEKNKVEFSGQVSAVAVKSGAAKNAKYTDGVAVFTQSTGGLMAEASVGGQKFTYKAL
jgi:lipid-binding SYLF domain-containing protein